MGLNNLVSDFFNKDPVRKDKDNVLIVSILFLTQERGWISTKRQFGEDDHFVEYKRLGDQTLVTRGSRKGKNLALEFEAHGAFATSPRVKEKLILDMDLFVDKGLQPINEELLRQKINGVLNSIENRIS